MLQKNSFTAPSDSSGIFFARVIQTRRCSTRRHAKSGKFLRVVIRKIKAKLVKRRKARIRAIVIRSSHIVNRVDGVSYRFKENAIVTLKKRMNTFGKETLGPTCLEMKIKKFRNSIISMF